MVAAGETHSLFLFELGEVYSAGFNEFGELGI
jgi:alpha-tubulin suppressor-like RCC1 family protein